MRNISIFLMVVLAGFTFFSGVSQAEPKPWIWSWWPGHWYSFAPEKPYLEGGIIPHNSQWENAQWSPQDWIDARGSAEAVMGGFYHYGIITDQYEEDDIPVLEVGKPFTELSGQEQRRVTDFVDYMFKITSREEDGIYYVYFEDQYGDDRPIGIYTKHGLQLQ